MKIFLGQIYIQPEINFFFSYHFQKWIGEELTRLITPSELFLKSYTEDFDLIFRLSAKSELKEPEIKGPTVFKKDRSIEYTIFLPHNGNQRKEPSEHKNALGLLFGCIVEVFKSLDIDTGKIEDNSSKLIEYAISTDVMFEE